LILQKSINKLSKYVTQKPLIWKSNSYSIFGCPFVNANANKDQIAKI
jgi:hypothetical protein